MPHQKGQFVSYLSDFSSSYGSLESKTYDVTNIVGTPKAFGDHFNGGALYGDHTASLVFRTYGNYWNSLPFHKEFRSIGIKPRWFQASDFIELEFDEPVFLTKLHLYETFCPGGLTRILISDLGTEIPRGTPHLSRWRVIWSQPSFVGDHMYSIAAPALPEHSENSTATYRIRLEFDDKLAEYYHELDGVKIFGCPWTDKMKASDYLLNRIKQTVSISVPTEMLKKLKLGDSTKNIPIEAEKPNAGVKPVSEKMNFFDKLPLEIIQMIFSFVVDLSHRSQASQVSKMFHRVVTDQTAIKELNLQPYYTNLNRETLPNLSSTYGPSITKLDLSWTGFTHSRVTSKVASKCLASLPNMEELKCRNCHSFVDNEFLDSLSRNCPNLKLLDLFKCGGFHLALLKPLKHLEFLDISQCSNVFIERKESRIEPSIFKDLSAIKWFLMGRVCRDMFGSGYLDDDFEIAAALLRDLTNHCTEIRGLNLWRQSGIGHIFPDFVKKFGPELRYLDLGWTSLHRTSSHLGSGWDRHSFWDLLLDNCPKLEYLALTAVKIPTNDEDLHRLARKCPNLEQVDFLGQAGFGEQGLHGLLTGCKNMKFLDLSYAAVSIETAKKIKEAYPHCDIKHVPTILHTNRDLMEQRVPNYVGMEL